MKLCNIVASACLGLVFLATAKADTVTVAAFSTAVTASDPTELGRGSRSSIPQDWSGTEMYTGRVNTPTATPEPSTFVMIGTGLLSMGGLIRRRILAS